MHPEIIVVLYLLFPLCTQDFSWMSSVLITILVHLSSHCHSIQICTLGVHVTTTVWWRHTSDKVLLCVGSLRGESALLFHQLYIFPFFFLIENLFNIYLNVICIFFISRLLVIAYFLCDHPCFKEIQMNSATEILITGEQDFRGQDNTCPLFI